MRAAARIVELLEALRASQLYRSPEAAGGGGQESFSGGEVDTRSNDYLGLAATLVGAVEGEAMVLGAGGASDTPPPAHGVGEGSTSGHGATVSRETGSAGGNAEAAWAAGGRASGELLASAAGRHPGARDSVAGEGRGTSNGESEADALVAPANGSVSAELKVAGGPVDGLRGEFPPGGGSTQSGFGAGAQAAGWDAARLRGPAIGSVSRETDATSGPPDDLGAALPSAKTAARDATQGAEAAPEWLPRAEVRPSPNGLRGASESRLGLGATVSRETEGAPSAPVRSGAGASRLVSGTTAEHEALERELAAWLGVEAALVFSSAYAANVGVLSALGLQGDVILSDELNHASIIDGCRLSRAETVVIPHRDLAALAVALARPRPARSVRWVVTESYFSMDGTSPDFGALRELCDRHDAALIVDETHSLGVFGPEGRGLAAAAGARPDLLVGGLGKAVGLQGGFVAGPLAFQQWLWNRARSFVFSTGVSPWLCARALVHLRHVRGADAARAHLAALGVELERALVGAGLPLPAGRHGPLFPVIFGTEAAALAAAQYLGARGVRAQAIRPPTVPRGSARLRLSLRADMSGPQLELLTSALVGAWREHQERLTTEPPDPEVPPTGGSLPTRAASDLTTARHPAVAAPAPPSTMATPGRQQRWIILGTGTGIGKSYVARALVRALAETGLAVAGLKPVETGCRISGDGCPREGDAALLEGASSGVKHPRPHPLYGFRDPIAPSLAAHREGQNIDIDAIASWVDRVRCQTSSKPALVIETAGGVFSPLDHDTTNFELARTLGDACWILVAPDRLGVLHDVTSTLRAMAALGRSPDVLVLSAPVEPDASTGSNADELRRLGLETPLLELGREQPLVLAALHDAGFRPAAE